MFRLWKSLGSGSALGARQYLAQFSKNKKIVQNLVFKILFPRKLTFLLDFVLAPNPNPVPQRQNVAVPVPQH
jgi:hypothetical protein